LSSSEGQELLVYEGVEKSFGGVHALRGVSFGVLAGEVQGLVGENGAGKSTLIKVTGGLYPPDAGRVLFGGRAVSFHSPRDSELAGIRIVHQEVPICLNLSVAENIFLDPRPPRRGILLDRREMNRRSVALLKRLGIELDPQRSVGLCSPAERQLILIAKALAENAQLVILDEATSSLSDAEVKLLFDVIRNLRSHGTTFMFVSHRLNEVASICDRITVLRNGQYIGTYRDPDPDFLTEKIVGKELENVVRGRRGVAADSPVVLEVKELSEIRSRLSDISFRLHRGEVLGLAGLRGAGRTELLETLFGLRRKSEGAVTLGADPVGIRTPKDAIERGIGFLNESRNEALYYSHSVRSNVASVIIDRLKRFGILHGRRFSSVARECVKELGIATPSIHTEVRSLSGGNQQKVLLGRWLASGPKILLLDEPTRGVDVGAKNEIRKRILELAEQGVSIIYVSLDFEELVQVCDRVLIICQGTLIDQLSGSDICVRSIVRRINAMERERVVAPASVASAAGGGAPGGVLPSQDMVQR
jgi:ABC-type sugar transport system ATPase subunit